MLKTSKLNYPAVDTWFIGWDDNRTEIKAYSMVATTQCMISPWNEMDYYTMYEPIAVRGRCRYYTRFF